MVYYYGLRGLYLNGEDDNEVYLKNTDWRDSESLGQCPRTGWCKHGGEPVGPVEDRHLLTCWSNMRFKTSSGQKLVSNSPFSSDTILTYLRQSQTIHVSIVGKQKFLDVFLTVHHSIDLFNLPTLMHNPFIH